jgi:hypothetical protein
MRIVSHLSCFVLGLAFALGVELFDLEKDIKASEPLEIRGLSCIVVVLLLTSESV